MRRENGMIRSGNWIDRKRMVVRRLRLRSWLHSERDMTWTFNLSKLKINRLGLQGVLDLQKGINRSLLVQYAHGIHLQFSRNVYVSLIVNSCIRALQQSKAPFFLPSYLPMQLRHSPLMLVSANGRMVDTQVGSVQCSPIWLIYCVDWNSHEGAHRKTESKWIDLNWLHLHEIKLTSLLQIDPHEYRSDHDTVYQTSPNQKIYRKRYIMWDKIRSEQVTSHYLTDLKTVLHFYLSSLWELSKVGRYTLVSNLFSSPLLSKPNRIHSNHLQRASLMYQIQSISSPWH